MYIRLNIRRRYLRRHLQKNDAVQCILSEPTHCIHCQNEGLESYELNFKG